MQQLRRVQVLDFGYIEVIESWGSDERIIEAARESTQKGFEGWGPTLICNMPLHALHPERRCDRPIKPWNQNSVQWPDNSWRCEEGHFNVEPRQVPGDEKLLKYLYENKHATPFEFAGLVIEVQAPIFVFREWHRHRTQSYAEMSARYAPLPDFNYVPSVERLMIGGGHLTKQAGAAKGAEALTREMAECFQVNLRNRYEDQEQEYQRALRTGVPKELARLVLPVGRYSRMRAATCLRNWLAFLTLRLDEHAQWEIQQYANVVGGFIKSLYPRTWELFELEREEWRAFQEWRKERRRG